MEAGVLNVPDDSPVFCVLHTIPGIYPLLGIHQSMEGNMLNVSKQIYRELNELLPDLQQFKPFDRVNLAGRGLPDINAVVFDMAPDKINFILGRHIQESGRTVANPCFEIAVNPEMELANVVTYKDDHYFHDAKPEADEIGTMAQTQANRLLYRWLHKLKGRTPGILR